MKALRIPLLLFALPAVLLALAPDSSGLFLLDRAALDAGEVWRLWSGHWAHFSNSHLGWNLTVLLAAGAWLEWLRPGLLLRHTLIATPFIGLAVLVLEPGLTAYGGLSGLATGVVTLLALHQLRTPGRPRLLWAGMLVLVALKAFRDLGQPDALLVGYGAPDVRTSAVAHAAGAVAAGLHRGLGRLLGRAKRRKVKPPGPVTDSRRQGSGELPLTTGLNTQTY